MKIVAIDFETANYSPVSMCAVGLATFEQGQLTESKHWLVKPPKGHGWFIPEWTQDCHGLLWFDVKDVPEFSVIAPEFLKRLINAAVVVAQKAAFDMRVLERTLAHYGLPFPTVKYLCTYRLSTQVWPELPNNQLSTVAAHIGHEFQHHQARSDAEAAGRVFMEITKHSNILCVNDLLSDTAFVTRTMVVDTTSI